MTFASLRAPISVSFRDVSRSFWGGSGAATRGDLWGRLPTVARRGEEMRAQQRSASTTYDDLQYVAAMTMTTGITQGVHHLIRAFHVEARVLSTKVLDEL